MAQALFNHLYSNGNIVNEYDLVPFGTESMKIYAMLVYEETEPNCLLNGHKEYYENTQDGCFYEDAFCTVYIGDADDLEEWLSDENGGLNGEALGHIDENADGECDRCEKTLVEIYPEVSSTCEEYGRKAYYRNTADGLYYRDIRCTDKIGIYGQLQTWLSGEGRLPLAEHVLSGDGTCAVCGAKLYTVTLVNTATSETVYSGLVDCTDGCVIENIANGTYIMTVSCGGMVTRTYPIEVTDGRVNEEVSLNVDGDVNSDGVIDENDYQQAVNIALSSENSVSETDDLSEDTDYSKAVADLDGDGAVDVIDVALLERKINYFE